MRRWKNVEIMNRIRLVVIDMQMTVGPIVDILAAPSCIQIDDIDKGHKKTRSIKFLE